MHYIFSILFFSFVLSSFTIIMLLRYNKLYLVTLAQMF